MNAVREKHQKHDILEVIRAHLAYIRYPSKTDIATIVPSYIGRQFPCFTQ